MDLRAFLQRYRWVTCFITDHHECATGVGDGQREHLARIEAITREVAEHSRAMTAIAEEHCELVVTAPQVALEHWKISARQELRIVGIEHDGSVERVRRTDQTERGAHGVPVPDTHRSARPVEHAAALRGISHLVEAHASSNALRVFSRPPCSVENAEIPGGRASTGPNEHGR